MSTCQLSQLSGFFDFSYLAAFRHFRLIPLSTFSALHSLNVSTSVESTVVSPPTHGDMPSPRKPIARTHGNVSAHQFSPVASLRDSAQKLLTALQAATELMNGSLTAEGCQTHQDILRHLGFHRCVIDAEGESILSVLAAGADQRDQERLSAYYATSRQPQVVLSEERQLIISSFGSFSRLEPQNPFWGPRNSFYTKSSYKIFLEEITFWETRIAQV